MSASARAGAVAAPAREAPRRGSLRDRQLRWLLVLPAFAVIAGTLLYPLASGLWLSFQEWDLARSPAPTGFVGTENYLRALTDDPDLWTSLRVTAVFTALSVVFTLTIAMLLALLLAGPGRLKVSARTLLVIPFAMSPALVGVSWRFLLNPEFGAAAGLLGAAVPSLRGTALLADPTLAMAALVLTDVWHWAPYFMLMFIGALASLPQDTVEAASVDGASAFRAFFEVVLPQLKPVIAIAVLLKTIFSLKVLDQVVMLTAGGPGQATETLSHLIYQTGFRWYDLGYAAALAYLLAALMSVFAALYFRLIRGRRA
ncbi:carbohydrate ABC transporter permease [Muricoccus radiodurans]|uniref:carbohydrate ABC transporter permease n=1 Tax=Muricoccus radiodurans TaxID=2231721 RepID=UPI003CEC1B83